MATPLRGDSPHWGAVLDQGGPQLPTLSSSRAAATCGSGAVCGGVETATAGEATWSSWGARIVPPQAWKARHPPAASPDPGLSAHRGAGTARSCAFPPAPPRAGPSLRLPDSLGACPPAATLSSPSPRRLPQSPAAEQSCSAGTKRERERGRLPGGRVGRGGGAAAVLSPPAAGGRGRPSPGVPLRRL